MRPSHESQFLQEDAHTGAPCILGLAITAAADLRPAAAAYRKEESSTTSGGAAGIVMHCSLRLTDGNAALSSGSTDASIPPSAHASCSLERTYHLTSNRHPPATPVPSNLSPNAHRPIPKYTHAAASHLLAGSAKPQSPSERSSAQPCKLRHAPSVGTVAGTDRTRLGFTTDPASLDACLQLGVVDPAAGCQVPVALDASPAPRLPRRANAPNQVPFALFHAPDQRPAPTSQQGRGTGASAQRIGAVALHGSFSNTAAAAISGLRTRPAAIGHIDPSQDAASARQPAAASVRASRSIYGVVWEVAAAPVRAATTRLEPHLCTAIDVQAKTQRVRLQTRKPNGAS